MANLYVNDGGDARLEDENGNVVARYDESAGEWQLNGVDLQGVGALDSQSVSTDQATIGRTIHINENVSDVGAAINDAISTLGEAGGKIVLPSANMNLDTPVNLDPSTTARSLWTPTKIVGPGSTSSRNNKTMGFGDPTAPAGIDARGVTGPIFEVTEATASIHLEGFSIQADDSTAPVIDFLQAYECTLADIQTYGGDVGFDLKDIYGTSLKSLTSYDAKTAGFAGDQWNAVEASNIVVRRAPDMSGYAFNVTTGTGATIRGLYAESIAGRLAALQGNWSGAELSGVYGEQCLGGFANGETQLFYIGTNPGSEPFTLKSVQLASQQSNPSDSIVLDVAGDMTVMGINDTSGASNSVRASSNFGGGTFMSNSFGGGVDTSSAAGASTWMQNSIGGTINRLAGDTVVSGD